MSKPKKSTIEVQGSAITILAKPQGDYISLTDMVRNFEGGGALIEQWLKNKDTVLFLGAWERMHNLDFNSLEFMNAEFIHMNLPQGERLKRLNQIAIRQMQTLTAVSPKALPATPKK